MPTLLLSVLIAASTCGILLGIRPGKLSCLGWTLVGLVVLYGLLSTFLPERLRRRRINSREPLDFDQIYNMHFIDAPYPKELLASIWQEAAEALRLDAAKLRPTDRLSVELEVRGFPLVDLNGPLIALLVEQGKCKKGDYRRFRHIKLETLADYILLMAQLKTASQKERE